MITLFLIATIFMFIGLFPKPTRCWRREKTAREKALHNHIQKATNWSPNSFYQRPDGRWFNASGEEGVCMTLEEFLKSRKLPKGSDKNEP